MSEAGSEFEREARWHPSEFAPHVDEFSIKSLSPRSCVYRIVTLEKVVYEVDFDYSQGFRVRGGGAAFESAESMLCALSPLFRASVSKALTEALTLGGE